MSFFVNKVSRQRRLYPRSRAAALIGYGRSLAARLPSASNAAAAPSPTIATDGRRARLVSDAVAAFLDGLVTGGPSESVENPSQTPADDPPRSASEYGVVLGAYLSNMPLTMALTVAHPGSHAAPRDDA